MNNLIELHVHLEGTIRPELALRLAHKNHYALPESIFKPGTDAYQFTNFLDFIKAYDIVAGVIKNPEDYYEVTKAYLAESAASGVLYCELMFSPSHAKMLTNCDTASTLLAVNAAIMEAERDFGITARIIITAVRHLGVEDTIVVAREIESYQSSNIVGFGLAGDEIHFPPEWFTKPFDIARQLGLGCTVHAGEHMPAQSVRDAILHLPVSRIGHGVRAIEDKEVCAMIKDKGIALEICPSSNIVLRVYDRLESHPLAQFYDMGISISINSDDPPFFATSIAQEHTLTQKVYNFNDDDMQKISRMAIEASFAEKDLKKRLLLRVNENKLV